MTGRILIAWLVFASGTACAQSGTITANPAASNIQASAKAGEELPIRRITLYRSGVASFERRGVVVGDTTTQLRFETRAINDVLKSMLVLDLSGQGQASISYGSKEPLARRLASFGVDISDQPSLDTLLARLRGSRVNITLPDGAIAGTILGGDARRINHEDGSTEFIPLLNVVTDTGIRQVELRQARSVELADPKLAQELARALAAVDEQRAERIKAVDLRLSGEGRREIVAAYVLEAPVWKTSYRLVLPDGDKGRTMMQGWAIVENTTDDDWKDVRLALVSGRPVSFTMDLYEPLFTARPAVPVPLSAAASPRAYAAGERQESYSKYAGEQPPKASPAEPERARASLRSAGRGIAPGSPARGGAGGAEEKGANMFAMDAAELSDAMGSGAAAGVEKGEVFQYELEQPVSIERQRSAMLPILSAPIDGRRLSIFNPNDGIENPMRGVEIVNTTDLQLIPGPISVYDAGTYAGDAQVGHVGAGDKRLLAYAVDLDVTCRPEQKWDSNVRKVRVVKGLLEISRQYVGRTEYKIANKDQKRGRTVLIEHPRNAGEKLREPAKPAEETSNLYRFEVTIEAGKNVMLAVVTERTDSRMMQLLEIDLPTLLSYRTTGDVSDAVVNAFKEAARRQGVISDLSRAVAALDTERQSIDTDQNRIRQNMGSIDKTSQLYGRYMTKLTEQETRLEAIASESAKLRENLAKAQTDLASYIADLSVE